MIKLEAPTLKLQMPLHGIPTYRYFDGTSSNYQEDNSQLGEILSLLLFGILVLFGTWRLELGTYSRSNHAVI
ncbi:MAG: hypothetical protein M1470_02660 [Bacteroidetes bacterium]|nr:hypothetical protein [Bacteroidota bacterium]MCL5737551.1 hypothetical protein [Bacteroidota bacterium]